MTLRINHNASAVNAHRNVQTNEQMLTKSLEKLSSGLSVVRAADGPSTLIISEHIRSQIKGTEQAIRNSEAGIAMVQTTEANLEEANRILTELRARAVHAANDAVNDEQMLRADQFEIDNLLNSLDRISRNAAFGKKKLLDGSNAAIGVTTSEDLEFINADARVKSSSSEGYMVSVTQNSTRSFLVGTRLWTRIRSPPARLCGYLPMANRSSTSRTCRIPWTPSSIESRKSSEKPTWT